MEEKGRNEVVVVLGVLALIACGCSRPVPQSPTPTDFHFLVPAAAQSVKYGGSPIVPEVSYTIAAPYLPSQFICDLTTTLDHDHWRALREDPLNPGRASSIVEGWGDFINAIKKPETHVHSWSTYWVNDKGDLLLYWLEYEYPEGAKPDFRVLKVQGGRWPADVARTLTGRSGAELSALTMSHPNPGCVIPVPWSEFVRGETHDPESAYVPYEMAGISALEINQDIDGLARRMVERIHQKIPGLKIGTVRAPLSSPSPNDATLAFAPACRCRQRGAPDGFYVREVVVYKRGVTGVDWNDPARVLFYWSDKGDPAWKHVSDSCFSERVRSQACTTAFQNADISFTDSLVSALSSWRQPQ